MRWAMRGLLLVVLSFANLNEIWSPDVVPNALLTWTLVHERDVDYDEFVVPLGEDVLFGSAGGVVRVGTRLDREAYFFRACGVSTATEPPKAVRSIGGAPPPRPDDRPRARFPPGGGRGPR